MNLLFEPNLRPSATGVGIKDVARRTGVSIGTVHRALNDQPEISPGTRARVLAAAAELGYAPNLAARYLRSRKQLRIAVHLPDRVALFWEALREGIREASAPLAPAIQVAFHSYPRLGEGDIPLIERALADGVDGLIIAPGNPAALAPHLEAAARQKVAVVCVVTDAPRSPRLLSVSADSFTVGAVAGELLGRFLPGGGQVGFFTGWLTTQDHADKLRGFTRSLATINPGLTLGPVVEAHDDEREARRRTREVLRAHPHLRGLYISTSNSLPVLRAAEREGRLAGLTVVATDLFPELVDLIRLGKVAATVYQRPLAQGRIALESLCQFLQNRRPPAPSHRVVPYVVVRSNLDVVLE
ncbi:MAG TPA: substrate-binding domain-containing protein, partial [Vicinamibacterales bacterium]|nr:substrate-binding domain-containing protein [Vicinamibacterales bacterium]